MNHQASSRRSGMILILVLVVVAMLSLAGYTFAELMLTQRKAAVAQGKMIQARAFADSGVTMLLRYLSEDPTVRQEMGGTFDNPARFRGVLILDDPDPLSRGRFSIVAPNLVDGQIDGVRFGVTNESSKLNLNSLAELDAQLETGSLLLLNLPGMTQDLADAILDWLDEDDEPREAGAELDYYTGLEVQYGPANGPIQTLDELLLVRGMTPRLLYGLDEDRNGMVDARERAKEAELGIDNSDGAMDFGWNAYLTLHSAELNMQADGQPRIDINGDDLQTVHTQVSAVLGADWANFIVAYRQNGAYTGDKSRSGRGSFQPDFEKQGNNKFRTVLDLVGAKVEVRGGEGDDDDDESTILESPIADDPAALASGLPAVLDALSINPAASIPGRININEAARPILLGIPGLTPDQAEAILTARDPVADAENPGRQHESWLLAEGIVTLDEMKNLMPFVTAGGNVFRASVVGYYDGPGPAARIEAAIRVTPAGSRLIAWQDLSHLGIGYPRALLGVEETAP